ncbi:hypothetical protein HUT18_15070 [Streptomyces sp. NA04227]|nr:hypothetical protein HUT18_15070 [Streptomyces sp. NA04227]
MPGGGVVLVVPDGRPGPPPLHFKRVTDRQWVLLQGELPLIQARLEGEGCCHDLRLRRLSGACSPLPPLFSAASRAGTDWPHHYALRLDETGHGPLYRGRWRLRSPAAFAPYIWSDDLVRDWPDASLELLCGGGWQGVLPLRPFPAPDAPRVKAYRKQAREGSLAPVLLWWVSFLDGWLLLDGHDRAAAALAEGMQPSCVELARLPDDDRWQATADEVTEAHEEHMARLAARPASPETARQRQALERGYAEAISTLPYEADGTPVFD